MRPDDICCVCGNVIDDPDDRIKVYDLSSTDELARHTHCAVEENQYVENGTLRVSGETYIVYSFHDYLLLFPGNDLTKQPIFWLLELSNWEYVLRQVPTHQLGVWKQFGKGQAWKCISHDLDDRWH